MQKVNGEIGVILEKSWDMGILWNKVGWSPVNKIDNLNRDFFVLCHD